MPANKEQSVDILIGAAFDNEVASIRGDEQTKEVTHDQYISALKQASESGAGPITIQRAEYFARMQAATEEGREDLREDYEKRLNDSKEPPESW